MSAPEEGKPHRETRHREDKPSKRRHPHGKRHQADADSRPITEADLDSEASSLQDDDDLVKSLSRSSSRRTASSRNQPAQLAPGGPPPPTPITTKALSPANQAQTVPKATQQAYQPSGPPAPTPVHQPFPAQDHSGHSPPPTAADGAPRTTARPSSTSGTSTSGASMSPPAAAHPHPAQEAATLVGTWIITPGPIVSLAPNPFSPWSPPARTSVLSATGSPLPPGTVQTWIITEGPLVPRRDPQE